MARKVSPLKTGKRNGAPRKSRNLLPDRASAQNLLKRVRRAWLSLITVLVFTGTLGAAESAATRRSPEEVPPALKAALEAAEKYAGNARDLRVEVEMTPERNPESPIKLVISYVAPSTIRIRLNDPHGQCPYDLGSTDILVTEKEMYWSALREGLEGPTIHHDSPPWFYKYASVWWPTQGPVRAFPLLAIIPAFRRAFVEAADLTKAESVTILGRHTVRLDIGWSKDFGSRFLRELETRARVAIDEQSGLILHSEFIVGGTVSDETVVSELQTVAGHPFPKSGFATAPQTIWGRWKFSFGVPRVNEGLAEADVQFRPRKDCITVEEDPSRASLSAALKADPDDASAHFNMASLSLHNLSAAAGVSDHLMKAAKLVPKSPDTWAYLGYVYLNQGDLSEAASAMKKAAQLGYAEGDEGSIVPQLARTLEKEGRDGELVSFLRERMNATPAEKRFLSLILAEALARMGQVDEASRALSEAIGAGPPPSSMRELWHLRDAHSAICRFIVAPPEPPRRRGLIGFLRRASPEPRESPQVVEQLQARIDFSKKLAAQDNTNPVLAQLVADACAAAGKSDEARSWYARVVELDRISPRKFVLLGLENVDDKLLEEKTLVETAAGSQYGFTVRSWAAERLARMSYASGKVEKIVEVAKRILPDAGEVAPVLAAGLSYDAFAQGRLGWLSGWERRSQQEAVFKAASKNVPRLDEQLRAALEKEPDNVGLLYLFGISGITEQVEAEWRYGKGYGIATMDSESLMERGRAWEKLVELRPDNSHYWVCFSEYLDDVGRFAEAAEALQTAWELVGKDPEYLFTGRNNLALLCASGRMPEKAESLARLLEEKFPDDPRMPLLVGSTYLLTGRRERALPWLMKAFVRLDEDQAEQNGEVQEKLIECLAGMVPPARIDELLAGLQPWQREVVLRKLGMRLFRYGKHTMSLASFEKRGLHASRWWEFHDAPKAIPILETYLKEFQETGKDPGTVYAVLGMSYVLVGDLDSARKYTGESLGKTFQGLGQYFDNTEGLKARVRAIYECLCRQAEGKGAIAGKVIKTDQPVARALVWLRALPKLGDKFGPQWRSDEMPIPGTSRDFVGSRYKFFLTVTNEEGEFLFGNVADGEYDLAVGIPLGPGEDRGVLLPLKRGSTSGTLLTITGGSMALYPDIALVPTLTVSGYDQRQIIPARDIRLKWSWDVPKSFGQITYAVGLYPQTDPLRLYSVKGKLLPIQSEAVLVEGQGVTSFDPGTRPFPAERLLPYCEYSVRIAARDEQGRSVTEYVSLLSYPGGKVQLGESSDLMGSKEYIAHEAARKVKRKWSEKDYENVIGEALKWLKKYPDSIYADDVQVLLAMALFRKGDEAKAMEGFENTYFNYEGSPGVIAMPELVRSLTEKADK